jgi:hypothetical protein
MSDWLKTDAMVARFCDDVGIVNHNDKIIIANDFIATHVTMNA